MYTIAVEMPSGARSRGYQREAAKDAQDVALSVRRQLIALKFFGSYVLILDGVKEISRQEIIQP